MRLQTHVRAYLSLIAVNVTVSSTNSMLRVILFIPQIEPECALLIHDIYLFVAAPNESCELPDVFTANNLMSSLVDTVTARPWPGNKVTCFPPRRVTLHARRGWSPGT